MQHDHQFSKLPRNLCPTCPASHKLSLAATSLEAAAGFLDKIMLPRAQETHWFEALVNLQLTCLIFLGKKDEKQQQQQKPISYFQCSWAGPLHFSKVKGCFKKFQEDDFPNVTCSGF